MGEGDTDLDAMLDDKLNKNDGKSLINKYMQEQ